MNLAGSSGLPAKSLPEHEIVIFGQTVQGDSARNLHVHIIHVFESPKKSVSANVYILRNSGSSQILSVCQTFHRADMPLFFGAREPSKDCLVGKSVTSAATETSKEMQKMTQSLPRILGEVQICCVCKGQNWRDFVHGAQNAVIYMDLRMQGQGAQGVRMLYFPGILRIQGFNKTVKFVHGIYNMCSRHLRSGTGFLRDFCWCTVGRAKD